MTWKLRTTESDDYAQAIQEAVDGKRSFVWFTASDPARRCLLVDACKSSGLTVLDVLPVWFVLACRPGIGFNDRERMCRSILRGAGTREARWRGRMFGYPEKDIEWYVGEVETAWERFYVWRESEDG